MTKINEFPYTVRDNSGQSMGSRRTLADARALADRLEVTMPAKGPYVIVNAKPTFTHARV